MAAHLYAGQVIRGGTTLGLEAAMPSLEIGQLCDHPVCTRYGVHVLRLDRKCSDSTFPFEQVHDRIAA